MKKYWRHWSFRALLAGRVSLGPEAFATCGKDFTQRPEGGDGEMQC